MHLAKYGLNKRMPLQWYSSGIILLLQHVGIVSIMALAFHTAVITIFHHSDVIDRQWRITHGA